MAKRLAKTKGLIFLLAVHPLMIQAEEPEPLNWRLSFCVRDIGVVYINPYPKWEHQQAVVHIAHPNLLVSELSRFYWIDFSAKYEQLLVNMDIQCIVELPTQDLLN